MTTYYYSSSGSNANPGTELLPKLNIGYPATVVGGDSHLFKRGDTWELTAASIANRLGIVATTGATAANPVYIGCYGDPALDPPKFDGTNTAQLLVWIRNGSWVTIEDIWAVRATIYAFLIRGNSASESPSNITLRRCWASGNNTSNTAGVDGITATKFTGAADTSNINIEYCRAWDNYGHGIKLRGTVGGSIRNCYASNNGIGVASHGIGTAGNIQTLTTWTLVSGTIYSAALSAAALETSAPVTSLDGAYSTVGNYFLLTNAGSSPTPALGEFSVPLDNLVYFNVGANPNTGTNQASKGSSIDAVIEDNVVLNTVDFAGNEGHGIGCDDFSRSIIVRRNYISGNQGFGITFNKNYGSTAYSNFLIDNESGIGNLSSSAELSGNTVVQANGGPCLYGTSRATVIAYNNALLTSGYGIQCLSAITDTVTESNNCFFGNSTPIIKNTTPQTINAASFTSDPLLTADYKPTPASPLLGAGTHLGYTRDAIGKQRPNPPAIGAYDVATMRDR